MEIPADLKYTKEHEWMRREKTRVVVGITDYAQQSLGDITFVQVPKVGSVFKKGDVCATVESVKAVSDVYAPAGGKVVEVNEQLAGQPELVNRSPYGEGFLFAMESDEKDDEGLMDADAYRQYVESLS